jgi:carbon storage regulator
MLVLSRKVGESIVIEGGIVVCVLATSGGRVRLGIDAPAEVNVRRSELLPFSRREQSPLELVDESR